MTALTEVISSQEVTLTPKVTLSSEVTSLDYLNRVVGTCFSFKNM
jgi:hypothetical protein